MKYINCMKERKKERERVKRKCKNNTKTAVYRTLLLIQSVASKFGICTRSKIQQSYFDIHFFFIIAYNKYINITIIPD